MNSRCGWISVARLWLRLLLLLPGPVSSVLTLPLIVHFALSSGARSAGDNVQERFVAAGRPDDRGHRACRVDIEWTPTAAAADPVDRLAATDRRAAPLVLALQQWRFQAGAGRGHSLPFPPPANRG